MQKDKWINISAMFIFGSIGIFVRWIPLPSAHIALARGFVGSVILLAIGLLIYRKINWTSIQKNLALLVLSGVALSANWILLFEAYRNTSIAIATICYYFAPVLITVLSAFFLKERLTPVRFISVFVALIGLVLIAGTNTAGTVNHVVGIVYGLGAALMYAIIVMLNKSLKEIGGLERTFVQLGVSAIAILPYVLLTNSGVSFSLDARAIIALAVLCVVHTGIAYFMYFTTIGNLSGQTVALLSYIDPASAVIMSALIFPSEQLTIVQISGGVLVLGAMLFSEHYHLANKR